MKKTRVGVLLVLSLLCSFSMAVAGGSRTSGGGDCAADDWNRNGTVNQFLLHDGTEFDPADPADARSAQGLGAGYDFPSTDGTTGQVLETDGSGTLSWAAKSSTAFSIDYVDGSVVTALTSADLVRSVVHNYGQAAENVFVRLPEAGAGMAFDVAIGTAQAGNVWGVQADTNDAIYLEGMAGGDGEFVTTTPSVGSMLKVVSVQTGAGAFDWVATAQVGTWNARDVFSLVYEDGNNFIDEASDNIVVD